MTESFEELSRQLERATVGREVGGSATERLITRTAQQRTRVWTAANTLQRASRSLCAVRASTPSQVR